MEGCTGAESRLQFGWPWTGPAGTGGGQVVKDVERRNRESALSPKGGWGALTM